MTPFFTSARVRPPLWRVPPGPETRRCSSMRSQRSARARPDARLIVVPHEPTPEHLAGLDARASRARLSPPVRLSQATGPVPFLVVDRLGALATLYGGGAMAYVGGGFGRAGLHSVLEPAAWGLPVAFGPRWQHSRDAELLVDAGAGVSVSNQNEMARAVGRMASGRDCTRGAGTTCANAGGRPSWGGATVGGDAGRAYFVTTPSNVTERGTTSPAVNSVKRRSLQRLRTLIFSRRYRRRHRADPRGPCAARAP